MNEKMKLRVEYSRLNNDLFSDNIPAYADFLENKLASKMNILNEILQDFEELKKIDSCKAIEDCANLVRFRIDEKLKL